MSIPVWGQLQKALDDPETIEEAIVRLINEHAADPTAHLGSGESLNAHKTDTILDHPAESVVADKLPFGNLNLNMADLGIFGFEAWTGSFSSNSDTQWTLQMTSQTIFEGSGVPPYPVYTDYPDRDLVIEFRLRLRRHTTTSSDIKFAMTNNTALAGQRVVWEQDGDEWYWRIYDGGTLLHSYLISDLSDTNFYYRIHYDPIREAIVLYVNGNEVTYYETADWKEYIGEIWDIYVDVPSTDFTIVGMTSLNIISYYNLN